MGLDLDIDHTRQAGKEARLARSPQVLRAVRAIDLE
jgi:hypothetical protein